MLPSASARAVSRCAACSRSRRALSTTLPRREPLGVEEGKRPIGAARGGALGFLLGILFVGSLGYTNLLQEYKTASSQLLAAVEDLQRNSAMLGDHLKRMEQVEHDLRELEGRVVSKEELETVWSDTKRLSDTSYLDLLDLKTQILDLETDMATLHRHLGTQVRI